MKRKQLLKEGGYLRQAGEFTEISDKIRKVTYNTDFFDRINFERRMLNSHSFNFDSGKIGKFIECEFEKAVRICMTKMTSIDEAQISFVIQASNNKSNWNLIGAFR